MRCPHCHAEDQHGRFCAKCGQPLYAATDAPESQGSPGEDFQPEEPIVTDAPASPAFIGGAASTREEETAQEAAPSQAEAAQAPAETTAAPEAIEDSRAESPDETTQAPATEAETPVEAPAAETNAPAAAPEENAASQPPVAAASAKPADKPARSHRKALAAAGLVCGLAIAAWGGYSLFNHYFAGGAESQQAAIADAPIVAPSGELAADAVVGHWQHYTEGSVIEKIGTDTYRWTIGDAAYEMKFKDGAYTVKDEAGNTYTFSFSGPNRLVLTQSADQGGGLVKDPVFENGFYCGRVGQDGSLSQNLSVNTDAFDILGRTYGELAGIYGPGALTVINGDQFIVFRGNGGNFAVQFSGATVPLAQETGKGYTITKLTYGANTAPSVNGNGSGSGTENGASNQNGTTGGTSNGNGTKTDSTDDQQEQKDYKLEIPDMPTFPSYSAVATGTVWMDLGFLVNNCPETMTVDDLSAILGISLEVGQAPASASGYTFFGMDEGYFAGTFSTDTHTFNVTGYGKSSLTRGKTQVFIQMIS